MSSKHMLPESSAARTSPSVVRRRDVHSSSSFQYLMQREGNSMRIV